MKLLDQLYDELKKSSGTITVSEFHSTVLGIKDENENSVNLVASIIAMDGRFSLQDEMIVLKTKAERVEKPKKTKKIKNTGRLTKKKVDQLNKDSEVFKKHIFDAKYVVLDFETTGISSRYNKVIEIGAVKIENGNIVDRFQTFVDPKTTIPHFITSLTGITNDMLVDAPDMESAFTNFKDFLEDAILVAHNLPFDEKFLRVNFDNLGYKFPELGLCTLKLTRRLLKGENLINAKLPTVAEFFNFKNDQSHRALGDATVTAKIFIEFLKQAEQMSIDTVYKLYCFQTRPAGSVIS